MSRESEVKLPRYELRPRASAFDLRLNRNQYGLVRRTIGRQGAQITQAKCRPMNISLSPSSSSSASSSPCRSRSSSPLPDASKRKIRYEPVDIDGNAEKRNVMANIQGNKAAVSVPKVWRLPDRATRIVRKPPPTVYDVNKGNHSQLKLKNHSIFDKFRMLIASEFDSFLISLVCIQQWCTSWIWTKSACSRFSIICRCMICALWPRCAQHWNWLLKNIST